LLDDLLDVTGVGVAVVDRALSCAWANGALESLLGHPHGWATGRSARDVLGEHWPTVEDALWEAFTVPGGVLRTRVSGAPPVRRDPGGAAPPAPPRGLALETRAWRDPDDPSGAVGAVVVVVRARASLAEVGRAWGDAERRYRLLAEQTTEIVSILDEQGTIRYISPSVRAVLGYDPDELVGRRHLPILEEDRRQGLAARHRDADVGEPVVTVVRVRKADGTVRWVESTSRRLHGDDGTSASYHVTSRDVTARVSARAVADTAAAIDRVLLEEPDLQRCLDVACSGLGALVEASAAAVWLVDGDELRPAAVGGPRADALRDAVVPVAPEGHDGEEHPVATAARTGDDALLPDATAVGPAPWRSLAAAAHAGAAVIVPVLDPLDDGAVVGVLALVAQRGVVVDDATIEGVARIAQRLAVARRLVASRQALEGQQAVLEQRVAERTADLGAAVAELESFSYSVSHDLRAPLRTIATYIEMVATDQRDRLDEHGRADLDVVARTVGDLAEMVDALLELARVSGSDFERLPVDLAEQARAVAAELARAHPGRTVRLVLPGEPLTVDADPRLTRVLLTNLLANAWKFTAGRDDATVSLARLPGAGRAAFVVEDNGVGFDPSQAHRLFVAFQRLHRSEDFPGTGVGLATVARVCRRHGGRVWAESEPGRGARFAFTLEPDEPAAAP
jgi:PAS domain S-box-containing protein